MRISDWSSDVCSSDLFIEQEDILKVFEGLTRHLLKEVNGVKIDKFPRMLYDDAMRLYGNDKPDIRFGMEFGELNEVAKHKDFGVFNSAEQIGRASCRERLCT